MKSELINKLEELLLKDTGEVAANVRTLQKEYQKLWTSEFEKAKQEFLEAGGKSKEFEYAKGSEDLKFEALIEKYNKLKKEADNKVASEQARNLTIRLEIIAKIKDITKLSENVGAAVRKLNELQTQWKETGPVSSHKYKEVQSEYSKAVEDIYYNLKIFRDLQEHDLKKNLILKTALIEKLKNIQSLENIKEAERIIKVYRNEWDEIGPVPNSKWEALKQNYKATLDETYAKIKSHYNSLEEEKEVNLKQRYEIIEKTRALIDIDDNAKASKWNLVTTKLLEFQNQWKNIGRIAEKDNEKTWKEFRALCNNFFDRKKAFFAALNEQFVQNRKIKAELIAKAVALQNSTDWQKTGLDLIRLQEIWRKHPGNGDQEEPKLFARFRKACNVFFDAKKAHFENIDKSYEQNLLNKEAILNRIKEFSIGEDQNSSRELLKGIIIEWNQAGHVPIKDKKRINDAFYNRLDELYDQLNLDKKEKNLIQYKTKIERFVGSENAFDLLRKESDFLKKNIDEITSQMRTYENNLGFFKSAKGSSNDFLKDAQEKIEAEKAKIADLTSKRKLVNEELARLREAAEVSK